MPGAETQTAGALDAVRYIYSVLPVMALVVAFITMWGFRLTNAEQLRLRAALEARDRRDGVMEI